MIVRLNFLYLAAPAALAVVATVGCLTAVYAAVIAMTQNDIKAVLAYSTISQLGYMFLAIGLAAFDTGIFHLVTHAFFKALLFLGAGSIIHVVHHNDLQAMGGLRKYMPLTFGTFLVAYLAIAGVPPFAGFFSKDEILWEAFNRQLALPGLNMALYVLGLLGAGITAFYMTRLMVLAFAGSFRGDAQQAKHLHESPAVMTLPLVVLALLSAVGGVIGLPELTHLPKLLHNFLRPVLGAAEASHATTSANALELVLILISIAVAFSGIFLGWLFYVKRPELPGLVTARLNRLYRLAAHKFYVDELYHALVVRPVLKLVALSGRFDLGGIDAAVNLSSRFTVKLCWLVGWEDLQLLDGAVNGLSAAVQKWGAALQRLQTGKVQHYLYSVVLGLFALYLIMQLA